MADRESLIWYRHGGYPKGTERGCNAINLYDPDTNLIAVCVERPDGSYSFLTTCKATRLEVEHLTQTNGNFVTEKILEQLYGLDINLQTNFAELAAQKSSTNPQISSPNSDFTPINSFESDVMSITPIDDSQSNTP